MECKQETVLKNGQVKKHHFEYLTSIAQSGQWVDPCVEAARDRWHIEESFNDQKNGGFNMLHLFSRSCFPAFCNWYQCLQMAHTIYQLMVKSREFRQLLDQHSKLTICHIWEKMLCVMTCKKLKKFIGQFEQWAAQPRQVRLC